MDRRFPHVAGRHDRYWLEDVASAKHSVFSVFPDISGVGTDPAASAARIRFEEAKVLPHVASQMRQWPRE